MSLPRVTGVQRGRTAARGEVPVRTAREGTCPSRAGTLAPGLEPGARNGKAKRRRGDAADSETVESAWRKRRVEVVGLFSSPCGSRRPRPSFECRAGPCVWHENWRQIGATFSLPALFSYSSRMKKALVACPVHARWCSGAHADQQLPVLPQRNRPGPRHQPHGLRLRLAGTVAVRLDLVSRLLPQSSPPLRPRRPSRSAPWARSPGRSRRPRSRSRATAVRRRSRPP